MSFFMFIRAVVSGTARRETPQSVLQLDGDDKTLAEDLKLPRGSTFDPIPAQLYRKYECTIHSGHLTVVYRYIAYSRKYIHPKLSEEAAKVLQVLKY